MEAVVETVKHMGIVKESGDVPDATPLHNEDEMDWEWSQTIWHAQGGFRSWCEE